MNNTYMTWKVIDLAGMDYFAVVNSSTSVIHSAWKDYMIATKVAQDLNRSKA